VSPPPPPSLGSVCMIDTPIQAPMAGITGPQAPWALPERSPAGGHLMSRAKVARARPVTSMSPCSVPHCRPLRASSAARQVNAWHSSSVRLRSYPSRNASRSSGRVSQLPYSSRTTSRTAGPGSARSKSISASRRLRRSHRKLRGWKSLVLLPVAAARWWTRSWRIPGPTQPPGCGAAHRHGEDVPRTSR
jgi:hypothetical protein